mmetsp:Transcript_386/g.857  ORF Transcript_386/g.857 Transcript_386/m.857 type:complete len:322 (+) Transcript_386:877-1842(+)
MLGEQNFSRITFRCFRIALDQRLSGRAASKVLLEVVCPCLLLLLLRGPGSCLCFFLSLSSFRLSWSCSFVCARKFVLLPHCKHECLLVLVGPTLCGECFDLLLLARVLGDEAVRAARGEDTERPEGLLPRLFDLVGDFFFYLFLLELFLLQLVILVSSGIAFFTSLSLSRFTRISFRSTIILLPRSLHNQGTASNESSDEEVHRLLCWSSTSLEDFTRVEILNLKQRSGYKLPVLLNRPHLLIGGLVPAMRMPHLILPRRYKRQLQISRGERAEEDGEINRSSLLLWLQLVAEQFAAVVGNEVAIRFQDMLALQALHSHLT